jgi:hypothetical protein
VKLDYHIAKAIANRFFGLFVGRNARPAFFDISEAYPERDHVTRAFPAIRAHDVDPGEPGHEGSQVDVRRPMPLIADWCNRFLIVVLARHTPGRAVVRKLEAFASERAANHQAAA